MTELEIGHDDDRSDDCNDDPVPPLHFFPFTGVAAVDGLPFGGGNGIGDEVGDGVGLGTTDAAGAGVIVGDGMLFHALGGPISGT